MYNIAELNSKEESELKSIATTMGIKKINSIDKDELIYINYNSSNQVNSVVLNTPLYNEVLGNVYILMEHIFQNNMEEFFKDLEIPIGSLISKTIFAGKGHIIDIPIIPIGSYSVDLKTKSIELGINSQQLEVYLEIQIDVETIIPFNPIVHHINSEFLLTSFLIQGNIPNYYYASGEQKTFPYVPDV